jgi:hypothetical protein
METGIIKKSQETGNYKLNNFKGGEIELIGYSFLVYHTGKLPRLKSLDERYIIYMHSGRICLLVEFNPFEMLKYVEDKSITFDFISGENIESDETDEFRAPTLADIEDEHVVKWLNEQLRIKNWNKTSPSLLERGLGGEVKTDVLHRNSHR